jgi:carboxypeptidase-like protein
MEVKGTVFDQSQLFALPGVSVMGTNGHGTMTDSTGHYRIMLNSDDSIYFSYLGKRTASFPVKAITPGYPLDMSLAIRVDSLPLVVVRPTPYRYDSVANRDEYRKVFDYQPDYVLGGANGGVGLNLDMIFNARKNRQMLALQRRLIDQEQDKYVSYRFNKVLVKRITGLHRPALDTFMRLYRPTYDFIMNCENDYEFYKYIKECGIYFLRLYRQEHPEYPG